MMKNLFVTIVTDQLTLLILLFPTTKQNGANLILILNYISLSKQPYVIEGCAYNLISN